MVMFQSSYWFSGKIETEVEISAIINPLSANSTEWSNTLKKFVRKSRGVGAWKSFVFALVKVPWHNEFVELRKKILFLIEN